jgi:hypothetical protein
VALKGDLSEFSVEHVLRLLALSARTGTLDVRTEAGRATIEVTDGSVSGARGTDDPEVALGRAVLAESGTFTFTAGPTAARTVDAPLDELLERAREKAREATLVEKVIPDENARFRLSERATSGTAFTVAPEELKVLMEVGGGRSVREVRQRTRLPRSRVVALLYALSQKGLIEAAAAEVALAVQTVGAPRRPRGGATPNERPAAPRAAAEAPIEIVAAPSAPAAADVSGDELAGELDARLAALAVAAPAEAPEAEASEEVIVVTPSLAAPAASAGSASDGAPEATVVFALHYVPATAQPVEPAAPPPAPKRRGLFDFVLRRPAAPAPQPEIDVPAPAELASLANALSAEYRRQADAQAMLGSYADASARAFEAGLPARLRRIYETRAVGARIPLAGDAIDTEAIARSDAPPARLLPTLALLVRDLRDEAIRVFGEREARDTYATVASRVFGREVASPTMIIRSGEIPARGRLRRRDGVGAPVELRDRSYTIGRAASSDIVVADEKVSSRHAQLVPDVLGFRLRDLGSTNGTFVNEQRLAGERVLRGGEAIRVGDTAFVYEAVGARS